MIGEEYPVRFKARELGEISWAELTDGDAELPWPVDHFEGRIGVNFLTGLPFVLYNITIKDESTGRSRIFRYVLHESQEDKQWAKILQHSTAHKRVRVDIFPDGSYSLPVVLESLETTCNA